jgi:hypothetical protein
LIEKNEMPHDGQLMDTEQELSVVPAPTARKKFVEPEVSSPIDVLEATSHFMQFASAAI